MKVKKKELRKMLNAMEAVFWLQTVDLNDARPDRVYVIPPYNCDEGERLADAIDDLRRILNG